jgi:Limiting CO2-inducible proteins B/C beta carbonyic anhydrases
MNQFVLNEYPNAETGESVTHKYLNFLEKEYQSDLKKMLFATSLCSDDINVSTDFRKVLARPFTMGGLGGLPYSGLTGMVAFAHHIPDGGDAFIFYAPHIGITDDGELGKMRRPGQSKLTNSCGALMLGLERLQQQNEVYVPINFELDYQQTLLEQTVMPYKQRILEAKNPKKEITEVFYEEIHKKIQLLVKMSKKEFLCKRVFLLGGIIINTSPEFNDMVDVRNFQVINTNEMEEKTFDISILETPAFRDL